MQKVLNILFSTRLTAVLFIVFFAAIGTATFVEEAYDTVTAKVLIYDALWLEVVMILMTINFIGNIVRYRLYRPEKIGTLIFHLAFVLVIIGAGVTRYTGYEGLLPIREGQSSNIMFSNEPYLQVTIGNTKERYQFSKRVFLSEAPLVNNYFELPVSFQGSPEMNISYKDFIKNAIEKVEVASDGIESVQLVALSGGKPDTVYVRLGEEIVVGNMPIAFENFKNPMAIVLARTDSGYVMKSPMSVNRLSMATQVWDTLPPSDVVPFKQKHLHQVGGATFVFFGTPKIKKNLIRGKQGEEGTDALVVNVDYKGESKELILRGGIGTTPAYQEFVQDDLLYRIGYGAKPIVLPFSVRCDDFILDRYPGSGSPSSYKSKVTVLDDRVGKEQSHEIYMNNVLDYDGFRFFQSSYDPDEGGTRLSVNHDFWGTWITYVGYMLLGLGFLLAIVMPKSRFGEVVSKINEAYQKRSKLTSAILLGIVLFGVTNSKLQAQNHSHEGHNHEGHVHEHHTSEKKTELADQNHVSKEHAEKLGKVLVLGQNGRFEPIHTLAYDFAHKVARTEKFTLKDGSTADPMQMFADMLINPGYWKDQNVIYLKKNTGVQKLIGVETNTKYVAFSDLIDDFGYYKIGEQAQAAWQKEKGKQNVLDKEIIKTDERLNLVFMHFQGDLMTIFPAPGMATEKWITWNDSLATIPLSANPTESSPSYQKLFGSYILALLQAAKTSDYTKADQILDDISFLQRELTDKDAIPSEKAVDLEIGYNKKNIFGSLKNYYGLIAVILLIFAIIELVREKPSKFVRVVLLVGIVLLSFLFLYHTYGLVLRWYLTGHAPWSDGYEALVSIAWGTILAGFVFSRFLKLTIPATALIAFFVLIVSGFNQYDPQLGPLEPVLKSYWLNIHVAVILISYGFFGLAFILALIALPISLFRNDNNMKRFNLLISELTYINELTIIVGVALATIGTFLGGVWANESWGRYWGWDQKETWALVIVLVYGWVLHFRLIPGFRGKIAFNVGSLWGFSSVIMTFVGVNYYLSKGLHSYAAGDTPAFPGWVWGLIGGLVLLTLAAVVKEKKLKK